MISIITPVYNGERFIESCIKVVIEQNCPDVEHIIVDGNSRDKTVDVIKSYADKYSHIRWISEKDEGQSDAMNKGVSMSRGEIISFLNVDDYYEDNTLNQIASLFENLSGPSFLVGNCNIWDDQGLRGINKPQRLKFEDLMLGRDINPYPVNPSAYFYHKSLHDMAGLYDVNEHYAMDYDFLFRAAQFVDIQYVDKLWGNMRVIQGTKTFNDSQAGKGAVRVRRLIRAYRQKLPLFERLKVTAIFEIYRVVEQISYFSTHTDEIIPKLIQRFSR